MLNEHTLLQLRALRLDGMACALSDPASVIAVAELPFDQRLALLVQREIDWRDNRRLARLLKVARLKVSSACLEAIDWSANAVLDREPIETRRTTCIAEIGMVMRRGSQHGTRFQLRFQCQSSMSPSSAVFLPAAKCVIQKSSKAVL